MTIRIFHRYDGWPIENTNARVPRITEETVRAIIETSDMIEERSTVGGPRNYVIRQYRHRATDEFEYIGGEFAN